MTQGVSGPQTWTPGEERRPRDAAARAAGLFLLLTALATVLMVALRVAADADQSTLAESLAAVSESRAVYGIGGAARMVSGVTLAAAAWFLLNTWIIRERFGSPIVPILFAVSGLFTLVSGACAVWLAVSVPGTTGAIDAFAASSSTEVADYLRWLTGKIGFAIAGLALLAAARYQWRAGGMLRVIAPVSVVIGISMQFIWIDSAMFMHRVSGNAFLLWIIVIGAMLATGRIERRFSSMKDPPSGYDAHTTPRGNAD